MYCTVQENSRHAEVHFQAPRTSLTWHQPTFRRRQSQYTPVGLQSSCFTKYRGATDSVSLSNRRPTIPCHVHAHYPYTVYSMELVSRVTCTLASVTRHDAAGVPCRIADLTREWNARCFVVPAEETHRSRVECGRDVIPAVATHATRVECEG